jgi:hypothetical protein
LSLLLCVAVCVLWVRSYTWLEGVSHCRVGPATGAGGPRVRFLSADSSRGKIHLLYAREFQLDRSHDPGWSVYSKNDEYLLPVGRLGFAYHSFAASKPYDCTSVVFPHWAACVLLLVPPAGWLWPRMRLSRRLPPDVCRRCGYDLRATPDRCPECGSTRPDSQ